MPFSSGAVGCSPKGRTGGATGRPPGVTPARSLLDRSSSLRARRGKRRSTELALVLHHTSHFRFLSSILRLHNHRPSQVVSAATTAPSPAMIQSKRRSDPPPRVAQTIHRRQQPTSYYKITSSQRRDSRMSGLIAKASKYRLTRRDSQIAWKTLRWLDSTRRGV